MDPRFGRTRAVYEADADDYARRNARTPEPVRRLRQRFAASLPRGARIVDLGCGPGRDARALLDEGFVVIGVDASVAMAMLARRAGVPVVLGDIRRPPLPAGSAAGPWAVASLLHVPSDDVPATLLEWRRILRPGGRLALSTAAGADEGWDRSADGPARWIAPQSLPALLGQLTDAGFAVGDHGEDRAQRRWLHVMATASP